MLTRQITAALAGSLCLPLIGCGSSSSSPSPSQTTPVATASSPSASSIPTSTAGRGRKSASTAVLPSAVSSWISVGGVVNLATSSTANYTSRGITGQALAVVLRRPDADASMMGHAIPNAKTYDKAVCGDIGTSLGHTCYVQLLGGVMNVTTSKGVTLAQTASLANLLYKALRG